jgi:hypothetical protein
MQLRFSVKDYFLMQELEQAGNTPEVLQVICPEPKPDRR